MPPIDTAGQVLSAVPSYERDNLQLAGYNESSVTRTSGDTARTDGVKKQTVLGWTCCPKGCGCKCRVLPVERDVEEC